MQGKDRASILLPSLNGFRDLQVSLPRILSQVRAERVWVIDSGSGDGTVELAQGLGCRIHRIPPEEFGHGRTRNLAAHLSREDGTDFMVFLTQDAIPADSDWLGHLLRPLLGDETVAATYARQVPRPEASPIESFARRFNYPETQRIQNLEMLPMLGIKTFFLSNACAAYRRKAFDQVGGFPDDVVVSEDMAIAELFVRKGLSVAYVPEACVVHSHSYTLADQFRRYFDIGVFLCSRPQLVQARLMGEGTRFFREQLAFLWRTRQKSWIHMAVLDSAARLGGLQMGLRHGRLSVSLCRRFSRQRSHWNRAKFGRIDA